MDYNVGFTSKSFAGLVLAIFPFSFARAAIS